MIYELDDVHFAYPGAPEVLCGITLAIDRGETVALMGSNGSGKSTLLKVLAGLEAPHSGSATAFGYDLKSIAGRTDAQSLAFRSRVGFVFQNADAQLFCPTVGEELAFAPRQAGLSTTQVAQRVSDTAAMLGISGMLDRAPYRLSGGEKRKVALGCVLTYNPEVLLLDEPMTGLDPRSQLWMLEFLKAIADAGKTVVTATHDLDQVADIAGRALVMGEDHRIAADAAPGEVLADRDLLIRSNLAHERSHSHGTLVHSHFHPHGDA